MTITAEQTAAITAELSVDLSTVTDDRLIELCLLHRSAPEALPTFPDLLGVEITRRFTAAEIAENDVMFSVIQNFSNNFDSLVGYQDKFYKLAITDVGQRDNWFRDNATFFYDVLHSAEPLAWLVSNIEIMGYVAQSNVAMAEVVSSSVATAAIFNSSNATNLIINSNIALGAVTTSSLALTAIVKSTTARNEIVSSSAILQANRIAIYNTVQNSWTKQAGVNQLVAANAQMSLISAAVASPEGFVFASLGRSNAANNGLSNMYHANGDFVASGRTSDQPTTLAKLDAISFNGATFKATEAFAQAYAELWIPPV